MTIVRIKHTKENPYVVLDKKALWDKNLSLDAVGLWARLLSRPDDWQIYVTELCASCDCGETKMYRILSELIDNGYAYRHHSKKKDGKFSVYEYFVFETKTSLEQIKIIFPHLDFPGLGEPGLENQALLSIDPLPSIEKETDKKPSPTAPCSKKAFDIEKKEREPHVFVSEGEHKSLILKCGNEAKALRCYEKLSEWKISHPEYQPKSDYLAILKWVIDSLKNEKLKPRDEELAKLIIEKFGSVIEGQISFGHNYVEFTYIPEAHYQFGEHGFFDKVLNGLRKMNLPVGEIEKSFKRA